MSSGDALPATTISKMFSSEQKFAYLLKVDVEGSTGRQTEFVAVTGPMLTWNQLLGRATGECTHQALREVDAVTDLAGFFRLCLRATTTDKAPANVVCEKSSRERTHMEALAFMLQCSSLCQGTDEGSFVA